MPTPTPPTSCPFCAIAAANPPLTPTSLFPPPSDTIGYTTSSSTSGHPPSNSPITPPPKAYILISTPHLLGFLDHAPISRGHVLVATRAHREKLGDASVEEGAELGKWLGVISRAVMVGAGGGVLEQGGREEKEPESEVGDWNVVQNNGARAAQVVPHVHFHIIPRIGDVPEVKARSWTVFGKGQREDLDDVDAEILLQRMRKALGKEIERVRRREGDGALRGLLGEGSKL